MSKVNREDLLQSLESVSAGIATREILEQSSCFVFKSKQIFSYNDEILCTARSQLNGITGAVQAKPLLEMIKKLEEEEIEVTQEGGELRIKGKRKEAGVRMESEVLLPVEQVEVPTEWKTLAEDFVDAIAIVQACAGRDESQFALTCVHITPKWVEACDRYQLTRYRLKTGMQDNILVRKESLKHIVSLGMTEFSETDSWIHFRNPDKELTLSCRRFLDDYPDLKPYLTMEGTTTAFPKGLSEAVERAEVFTMENQDYNLVRVSMKEGMLTLRGQGISGWYSERRKVKYDGPEISFYISPKILSEIVKKYHECEITEDRLKVHGGKWSYISVLNKDEGEQKVEEPKEE